MNSSNSSKNVDNVLIDFQLANVSNYAKFFLLLSNPGNVIEFEKKNPV